MMARFLDLKLSTKMLLGFILVGFILFFGTAVGVYSTYSYKEQLAQFYTSRMTPVLHAIDLLNSAQTTHNLLLRIERQPTQLGTLSPQVQQASQSASKSLQELEKTSPQDLKPQVVGLRKQWDQFGAGVNAALAAWRTNQPAETAQTKIQQDWDGFLAAYDAYDQQIDLMAEQQYLTSVQNFTWVAVGLAGAGSLGITIAILIGVFVSGTISKPVKILTAEMQHLSRGDVHAGSQIGQFTSRQDEIGQLARHFQALRGYLENAASQADRIASGKLAKDGSSHGDQDVLTNALNQMVRQLRMLVEQMQSSSSKVNQSARQLVQSATQTTQASTQVTQTIEKMADGITRQTEDMNGTIQALSQTRGAIGQVSNSAHKQAEKLQETLAISSQMDQSIHQFLSLVNSVAQNADTSAVQARDGAKILHQTLANMEEIRSQVNQLGERVAVMGDHSTQIGEILETIEEIATKTNILAINATIESAHAESQAKTMTEEILGQMMVSQCKIINHMLLTAGETITQERWQNICNEAGLDTILVTDEEGVTIQTNEDALVGWRFPEDPKAQAYPFRALINQKDGILVQASQERSLDKRVFKYVGVSRSDKPGIIQVGLNMQTMKKFDLQIHGFAVVANEVYQLAEHARTSTHEIRDLIRTIQASIREAQNARQTSQNEVNSGIESAERARKAFDLISTSVLDVLQLAQQAQQASSQMDQLSRQMMAVFNMFQQIVTENTGITNQMADSFDTISNAIESVARLSVQNTAAVQQVRCNNDVMRAQMADVVTSAETLNRMADGLQGTVQIFSLN